MISIESAEKTSRGDKIEVIFIFQGQPSTYYHDISVKDNRLTLEFYDAKLGEETPDPVSTPPFKGSQIEESEVDLNKDLEGMEPDIRKMVRVALYYDKGIDYEISDDFNVITLSIYYGLTSEGKKVRTTKGVSNKWVLPTILGGSLAIAGGIGYLVLKGGGEEDTAGTIPLDATPPDRPAVPLP
jgi:hypothetical protein